MVQKVEGLKGFVRSLIAGKESYAPVSGHTLIANKGGVREVLPGRYVSVEVAPLSLSEYLKFKGVQNLEKNRSIS